MFAQLAQSAALLRPAATLLLLGAAGAVLLLLNLGDGRVLTYHEVCFAQPAREMLATHRWIVPTIGGEVFPDKPPLTHWLIAASMTLAGSQAEWTARLPIAVAGVLTAMVLAMLARRWFGTRIGVLAGLIQLSCYYVLMQARLAECDMVLCLLVTIALSLFAIAEVESPRGKSRGRWIPVAFHLASGLGFLCKGPIALVFIGAAAGCRLLYQRRWTAVFYWLDPFGVAVLLLCIVGWPAAAFIDHPEILDGWRKHNLERFSGAMGEASPVLYYVGLIPLLMLPWTPFAVIAFWPRKGGPPPTSQRDLQRFLWMWLSPGLLVLSAAAWKHKHYVIPLLPPLTIFAAIGLSRFAAAPAPRWLRVRPLGTAAALLAFVAMLVVWRARPALLPAVGPLLAIATAGLILTLVAYERRRPRLFLAMAFALVWTTAGWTLANVVPSFDSYRDQTAFARRIVGRLPAGAPLTVAYSPPGSKLALPENQITYYLPLNLSSFDDRTERSPPFKPDGSPLYVLGPEKVAGKLAKFGAPTIVDQCDNVRGNMDAEYRLTLFRLDRRLAHREPRGLSPK